MVAEQYLENQFRPAAPAAPPASPPPKRFRRGLLVAVAAVALASGAGSGAAAAALIDQGASASAATVATTTSPWRTPAPASTAAAIYQQDSPSVVTITDVMSGPQGSGQAIGSGIVLDPDGDILTNAHLLAGARQIRVPCSYPPPVGATVVASSTRPALAVLRASVAASSLHPAVLGN